MARVGRTGRWLRRGLGALLVLLALLPGSRVLRRSAVGPFGEWVLALEAQAMNLMLWGSVTALGVGAVFATLRDGRSLRALLRRAGRGLAAIPPRSFALGAGVLSAVLAAVAFRGLFRGLPTNVDSIASLLQARYVAGGALSGPIPDPPAASLILNTLSTGEGWVSFYPPLHTALLAVGLRLGAPALVGPLMTGVAVAATCRLAAELLPDRPATARLGGLLVAGSPFVVFVGGTYLSHTTAAAGVAVAAWSAWRARTRGWGWAVLAGAATGVAVSARPWTGLVVCAGLLCALWLPVAGDEDRGRAWLGRRVLATAAGGLPFAAALLAYNAHFFGHPLRLGYLVAYGPAHGLGFHPDPWGYPYGPVEALGYTAADLGSLSLQLLETPLPAVAVVGVFLMVAPRLPDGAGPFLVWAVLPVAANVFYWHHGFHLGPRMLFEAAPAWSVLLALSATHLTDSPDRGLRTREPSRRSRYLSRLMLGAFCTALLGPLFLVPARVEANARDDATVARMTPPSPPSGPALVFVHGSWSERVSARLQATGIRMDSLEVALRRNDLCRVDAYARARLEGRADLPALDFRARPGMPARLERVELPGETTIRRDPGTPLAPRCVREMRADRLGTVPLAPLLWQGDLPGVEEGRPLFVRDLGPEANREVRRRFPERVPFLFHSPGPGSRPVLRPYGEGAGLLWGEGDSPGG